MHHYFFSAEFRVMRLALSTVLVVYIATLVWIRGQQRTDVRAQRKSQMMTAAAFFVVAVILFRNGGLARWPTMLPLAISQAAVMTMYLAAKGMGYADTAAPYDAFISKLAAAMMVGLCLYAINPSTERWARHVGVIGSVLCGLPITLLLPSLRTSPPVDTERIRRAMTASELVYTRGAAKPTFSDVEYISNQSTGSRCGVFSDDSAIYVAFAGSDSRVDWLKTNINVQAEPLDSIDSVKACGLGGDVLVHSGVLAALKSVRDDIWRVVSNHLLRRGGSGRIIVCGHSLGGATATIAGLDFVCRLGNDDAKGVSVITFGSPKVGNAAFAAAFAARVPSSNRVTTVSDPIPKLAIRDFVHVSTEYPVVTSFDNPLTAHMPSSYASAVAGGDGGTRLALTAVAAVAIVGLSSVAAAANPH